eukprot:jgi/Bigna1/72887/fgenesh1_pg.21_\
MFFILRFPMLAILLGATLLTSDDSLVAARKIRERLKHHLEPSKDALISMVPISRDMFDAYKDDCHHPIDKTLVDSAMEKAEIESERLLQEEISNQCGESTPCEIEKRRQISREEVIGALQALYPGIKIDEPCAIQNWFERKQQEADMKLLATTKTGGFSNGTKPATIIAFGEERRTSNIPKALRRKGITEDDMESMTYDFNLNDELSTKSTDIVNAKILDIGATRLLAGATIAARSNDVSMHVNFFLNTQCMAAMSRLSCSVERGSDAVTTTAKAKEHREAQAKAHTATQVAPERTCTKSALFSKQHPGQKVPELSFDWRPVPRNRTQNPNQQKTSSNKEKNTTQNHKQPQTTNKPKTTKSQTKTKKTKKTKRPTMTKVDNNSGPTHEDNKDEAHQHSGTSPQQACASVPPVQKPAACLDHEIKDDGPAAAVLHANGFNDALHHCAMPVAAEPPKVFPMNTRMPTPPTNGDSDDATPRSATLCSFDHSRRREQTKESAPCAHHGLGHGGCWHRLHR